MLLPLYDLLSFEKERRCSTRGGKPSKSLSEENCPLEPLRVFLFSMNSHSKTSEGPLRGSGIFGGSGMVVPLRRCTSVSLRLFWLVDALCFVRSMYSCVQQGWFPGPKSNMTHSKPVDCMKTKGPFCRVCKEFPLPSP